MILLEKSQKKLDAAKNAFDSQSYDVAVADAYYACYQLACATLVYYKPDLFPEAQLRRCNHKAILSGFSKYLINEAKLFPEYIRPYLKQMQDRRHDADYDPFTITDELDAEEILSMATEFCKLISAKMP